jgi:hypothetical protein
MTKEEVLIFYRVCKLKKIDFISKTNNELKN